MTKAEYKIIERLIKKEVKNVLNETLLTEMALHRKEYKDKIDSLIPQIIENWCLIKYATYDNNDVLKLLIPHWKVELRGWLLTAIRYSIKKNNSIESREKVLSEIWDDNDFNLKEIIKILITNKFEIEEIDTQNNNLFNEIINEFIVSGNKDLINVILSQNRETIIRYINTI